MRAKFSHLSRARVVSACAWIAAGGIATPGLAQQAPGSVPLDQIPSVFALAVDPAAPDTVLLGTPYGIILGGVDGNGTILDAPELATVGLANIASGALVASGFGADGGAMGPLRREATGGAWIDLAAGGTSKAVTSISSTPLDENLLAGLAPEIVLSNDGGASWKLAGTTPPETFAVALSASIPGRIWAATRGGLMASDDLGQTWHRSHPANAPATAVRSLADGRVMAFIYGTGLVSAEESSSDWQVSGADFGRRFIRDFATDPASGRLLALADTGAVLVSEDGGARWFSFEGSNDRSAATLKRGQQVFEENCQACHGVRGIGEAPGQPDARDEAGFKAPALDDSMHAWHHSDLGLMTTIRQGSPRNPRMIAWQEVLDDRDIRAVVAWIKTLWSLDAVACQGARHMACLQNQG